MVDRTIYQFWTGTNEMSGARKNAFDTCCNIRVPVKLLNPDDIAKLELKEHPFHPGYKYLSTNHRSDYLRSYILNFYGGGYADIKHYTTDNNWSECFDMINDDARIDIIGAQETPRGASIPSYNNPETNKKLLSNCFFICRQHSPFTEKWYNRVQSYMDKVYGSLVAYGTHDDAENWGPLRQRNDYPVPYYAVQGDIFHPLLVETYDTCQHSMRNALRPGYNKRIPYK